MFPINRAVSCRQTAAARHTSVPFRTHPMKKLTLQLESLQVQSFETASADGTVRGTVRANQQQDDVFTDGTRWWFDCFTITCICGASDKPGCTGAGCP